MKYGMFPIGHPSYITENFGPIESYYGLVKCVVLPPRKLYVPVLPANFNGKLVFSLCRTCAEGQIRVCVHSESERTITGTWCTPEIHMAINKGYKIVEIHEVWHYSKREQYNSETKTGGLFTDYINAALKTKQEASGFPADVVTNEQKQTYIKDYYTHEGI